MDEITFEDFTKERVDQGLPYYFRYEDGNVQICLEPCTGGFCVGIYDQENWILAEKKCTNMPHHPKDVVLKKAVELANIIYQDWKSKNVIE